MARCRQGRGAGDAPRREKAGQARFRTRGLARSAAVAKAGGLAASMLAASVLVALPVGATGATRPRIASTALVQVGRAGLTPVGARREGVVAPGRVLSLGVALHPRDPLGLAALAAAVSTSGSALFHHYLTPAQFSARFGPSHGAVVAVEHLLRTDGLSVGLPAANSLVVPVSGTARAIESAFHTRLGAYRVLGRSTAWAAVTAPRLPASVASSVAAVIGLDNLTPPQSMLERAPTLLERGLQRPMVGSPLGRSRVVKAPGPGSIGSSHAPSASPIACGAASSAARAGGGWTDQQVAHAYGLNGIYAAGDLGAGQTIDLFELEPFSMADVAAFDRCYFGRSHTSQISTVAVDGFSLRGTGTGEALLDVEDVSALAPAAKIVVYEAPNTTFGGIDAYNAIVSQDRAAIVSTSWGECESALQIGAPEVQQIENTLFEEAATQGQTIFAAAGDTGSDDCASTPFGSTSPAGPYLSVDDPASQPYAVGVGGTSLTGVTNPPSEAVWNDGAKWGGGGGGISNTWASPPWQAQSGVPGVAPMARRQVPDVSATADEWRGITVYSTSFGSPAGGATKGSPAVAAPSVPTGWTTIGGTSSAAPTWAAIAAEIAASPACAGLPPAGPGASHSLGFLAPELYAVASSPAGYASSFNDVRSGSNDVFGLGLGYRAGAGYDLASGLGTPIVTDGSGGGGLAGSLCALASSGHGATRPSITSLSPAAGPTTGGTTVTLSGSGFPVGDTGAVRVTFGGALAAVVSVPSSSSLVVTTSPAVVTPGGATFGGAGPVDASVTVISATGTTTSPPGPASVYDYVAPAPLPASPLPTVTGIGPFGGNVSGGATVTVYGDGFSSVPSPVVTFGGVPGSGVRVLSGSELTAVVPPESAATACATGRGFTPQTACQVQVVVSDTAGISPTATILPAISGPIVFDTRGVVEPTPETEVAPAPTEYDYAPTPVITSVVPNPGDSSGTTPVVITGTGFNFNTLEWVNFGSPSRVGSEQVDIQAITPTRIVIDPPPGASAGGSADEPLRGGISVQSTGGLSNAFRFSYGGVPEVRRLSVFGGPASGGTVLRISGAGLSSAKVVEFASEISGAIYGASASVVLSNQSSTGVTVTTPADLPGPVDVLPCSASGCARPDPRLDTFVYYDPAAPRLAGLRPRSGPAQGGTEVTLFGENLDGAVAVRFGPTSSSRLSSVQGLPDGDPFILGVRSAPGQAGRTVPVTIVTRSGRTGRMNLGSFHYAPSAPSAPRAVRLELHGSTATLRWTAPRSDGGARISGYTAIALAGGVGPSGGTFAPTTRSATFTRLASGRAYEFRVAAENAVHGRGLWASTGARPVAFASNGYRLATTTGAVDGFGSLVSLGGVAGASSASPVVAIAPTSDGGGYWLLQRDGTVTAFGDATTLGYVHPPGGIVAMAVTPTQGGYWLLGAHGGVYAFGDARPYGAVGRSRLLGFAPVGIAAAPGGRGYWIATGDGRVAAFGAASTRGLPTGSRGTSVVAIAAPQKGGGFWLVRSNGNLRSFGGAAELGQPRPDQLSGTVVGLTSTPDGRGYWIVSSTGAVYAFGDARYEGGLTASHGTVTAGIAAS